MKKTILLTFITIATIISSCYYDKEEELYPPAAPTCNPGTVTFSTTINSFLTTYSCNSCHSSVSPSGNISLTTYNGVKAVVNNGKLYGAITHAPGFSPMPQGSPKVNACEIAKVKAWIDAGAPNN